MSGKTSNSTSKGHKILDCKFLKLLNNYSDVDMLFSENFYIKSLSNKLFPYSEVDSVPKKKKKNNHK